MWGKGNPFMFKGWRERGGLSPRVSSPRPDGALNRACAGLPGKDVPVAGHCAQVLSRLRCLQTSSNTHMDTCTLSISLPTFFTHTTHAHAHPQTYSSFAGVNYHETCREDAVTLLRYLTYYNEVDFVDEFPTEKEIASS